MHMPLDGQIPSETVEEATTENVETPEAPEAPTDVTVSGTTAFIVMKKNDGTWQVLTDLTKPFAVSKSANIQDIKQGCHEVSKAIQTSEIAWAVVNHLKGSKDSAE
jgi:hypothetical protein